MANQQPRESDDTPIPDGTELSAAPLLSAKGSARRRFARMGAGATGALATLYSQPGMACTYCGLKPSGAVSAMNAGKTAAQMSHAKPCSEVGQKPSYWASQVPNTILFGDYFKCSVNAPVPMGNVVVKDLLNENSRLSCSQRTSNGTLVSQACSSNIRSNDILVARYLAAAMANSIAGLVTTLSSGDLQEIWAQYSSTRSYSPVPGVTWYSTQIVTYLSGTMD